MVSTLLRSITETIAKWQILNDDYADVISEDAFNFLDPPYLIKDNLYGRKGDMHKQFDHVRMAETLKNFKGKTMITYNSCPEVEELYPTFSKLKWDSDLHNAIYRHLWSRPRQT